MNAYEKAVSLGLTGTPAKQVAVLKALQNRDIPRSELKSWMADKGLLDNDGDSWFGLLQEKIEQGDIPGDVFQLIRRLKSVILGNGGEQLTTTDPQKAVMVKRTMQGLASIDGIAPYLQEFAELAGGPQFPGLTVAEFEAQAAAAATETEAAENRRVRQAALAEANDTAFNLIEDQPTITKSDLLTAFTARLDEVWL